MNLALFLHLLNYTKMTEIETTLEKEISMNSIYFNRLLTSLNGGPCLHDLENQGILYIS